MTLQLFQENQRRSMIQRLLEAHGKKTLQELKSEKWRSAARFGLVKVFNFQMSFNFKIRKFHSRRVVTRHFTSGSNQSMALVVESSMEPANISMNHLWRVNAKIRRRFHRFAERRRGRTRHLNQNSIDVKSHQQQSRIIGTSKSLLGATSSM